MSNVFWSPVRCLTASDKDPSTALGMTFVESRSLPFIFIPPWGDPSCAFGAALLQGPTHGAEFSLFLSFRFEESILRLWRSPFPRAYSWSRFTLFSFHSASRNPSCAFGAVLFQGPTHGADSLSFPFIPLRGSILRLWRAPSSRGYSISKTPFFHLNPSHQSPVTSR